MLANTKLPDFDSIEPITQTTQTKLPCTLRWRQGRLWVSALVRGQDVPLPALTSPAWFQACLGKSKATAVCIDPSLGTEVISLWAQACLKANKPLYLRIPAISHRPSSKKPVAWAFKCAIERLLGLILLVLLSPLILLFSLGLTLQDGGLAVTYEFCVGQRGRIFQMAQFRRASIATGKLTHLGRFLEVSRLDRLPRLVNVAKGEMTLVGTKPWAIQDLVNISPEYRSCLKAMPGLVGTRPLGITLRKVDIPYVVQNELSYLKNWSLWLDGLTATTAVLGFIISQSKLSVGVISSRHYD